MKRKSRFMIYYIATPIIKCHQSTFTPTLPHVRHITCVLLAANPETTVSRLLLLYFRTQRCIYYVASQIGELRRLSNSKSSR